MYVRGKMELRIRRIKKEKRKPLDHHRHPPSRFLVQQGALKVVNADDSVTSMADLYGLLATCEHGCSFNEFLAYCHLKSLGFIVGRHKVPWTDTVGRTMKHKTVDSSNKVDEESENSVALRLKEECVISSSDSNTVGIVDSLGVAIDGIFREVVTNGRSCASTKSCLNQDSILKDIHHLDLIIADSMDSCQVDSLVKITAEQHILAENDNQGLDHTLDTNCSSPLHHEDNNHLDADCLSAQVDSPQICADANISQAIIKCSSNQHNIPNDRHQLELITAESMDSWQENSLVEMMGDQLILSESDDQGLDQILDKSCYSPLPHEENNHLNLDCVSVPVDNNCICADSIISIPNKIETSKPPCGTCWHSDIDRGGPKLMFDVHLPNSRFKKTNPGTPAFSLCIKSDCPPHLVDLEQLEALSEGIPVKVVSVDCGRVSFFAFDKVVLPQLP